MPAFRASVFRSATCYAGRARCVALGLLPLAMGILFVMGGVPGCGQSEFPLCDVSGKVSFRGVPLTSGTVSLRPEEAGEFDQPTGVISPGGTFRVYTRGRPGAPAGRYRVVVFSNEPVSSGSAAHPGLPQSVIPRRYNDPKQSPLSMDVVESPEAGRYDLELVRDELPPR